MFIYIYVNIQFTYLYIYMWSYSHTVTCTCYHMYIYIYICIYNHIYICNTSCPHSVPSVPTFKLHAKNMLFSYNHSAVVDTSCLFDVSHNILIISSAICPARRQEGKISSTYPSHYHLSDKPLCLFFILLIPSG